MSSPSTSPKMACLCAPTSHAGSFRCRLHRPQQSWGRRPLPCRSSSVEDATDFAAEVEASVESRDHLSSCSSSSRASSVSPATSPTSMSTSPRRTSRLKHTVTFSQEDSSDASADKSHQEEQIQGMKMATGTGGIYQAGARPSSVFRMLKTGNSATDICM